MRMASPTRRSDWRTGAPFFSRPSRIEALAADEGAADQGGDLLGREGPEPAQLALGLAGDIGDQVEPAHEPARTTLATSGSDQLAAISSCRTRT